MEYIGPLFFAWLLFGLFSSALASEKGFSGIIGFFAGLFFGPLGFLYYIGAPDIKLRKLLEDWRRGV
ncbi:MAG: hypothetical protein HRF49_09650 [bacterium]|jgi:hypothetical protein